MTDLVSLFREKADEFLATINRTGGVRATIEALRRQMAEADRRRAMGRVKSELRRLDRQISEMITAVGLQAVALQEAGQLNSPELQPLCQHIIDLKATLSEQKAELAKLEAVAGAATVESPKAAGSPAAAPTTCANCGRPVPAGGMFCPYCGAPVAQPSVSAQSAPSQGATPAQGSAAQRTEPAPSAPAPGGAFTPRPMAAPPRPASPPPSAVPGQIPAATPQASPPRPTCAYCGAPLKPGAKFCSKCGKAV